MANWVAAATCAANAWGEDLRGCDRDSDGLAQRTSDSSSIQVPRKRKAVDAGIDDPFVRCPKWAAILQRVRQRINQG